MKAKPDRALTQQKNVLSVRITDNVEMKAKPDRALTQVHLRVRMQQNHSRNEGKARQGIDTIIFIAFLLRVSLFVEMKAKPDRALTQFSKFNTLHNFVQVEMKAKPDRALTQRMNQRNRIHGTGRNEGKARQGIDTIVFSFLPVNPIS